MKIKLQSVYSLLVFVFTTSLLYAQPSTRDVGRILAKSNEKTLIHESSRMMVAGYFTHAEAVVDKLLNMSPTNVNYNYRKGLLLMEMYDDYERAIPYLEKAVRNVRKNYDLFSAKEKSSFIDAHYHLARAYHLNHDFDKAIEQYSLFKSYLKPKNIFYPIAEKCIKQCELAKEVLKNPQSLVIERMSPSINTKSPEYAPVISADGNTLYFTSRRAWSDTMSENYKDHTKNLFPEDIFVSKLDEAGNWSTPERMPFCTPTLNEATSAILYDQSELIVYKDGENQGDVFFYPLNKEGNSLNHVDVKGVNTKNWDSHMMVTADGKTYYFVSDRSRGMGRRDIYSVSQDASGAWGKPTNLGATINSPFDEEAPFVSADGKKLYFSSNSEKSIGGFDIFVSEWTEGLGWGQAKNLGTPINSCADDVFYTQTADNATGYFSSSRAEGMGDKDIYTIHYILKGKNPGEDLVDENVINLPDVIVPDFELLTFKHLFEYDINKLKANKGELHKFLKDIETQIDNGRTLVTINVYSSASQVPTAKFSNNEELSRSRAENVKYDIMTYFQGKEKYVGKINVVIQNSVVEGPAYEFDRDNKGKYQPYQFILLKTE